jgi:hypothetical protein
MKNKLPITRLGKFFSETDFDLNVSMGMEYLHGDINAKLVLFRVDRQKTDTDDVYTEVGKDGIKFLSPIEFNANIRINEPENKTYKAGLGRYLEPGNLMIHVYLKHLEELKIDIKYGDYIGYPETEDRIRYYTVINDGKVTSDNKHSMFGYKPYYRTVVCSPAQETEFRGV